MSITAGMEVAPARSSLLYQDAKSGIVVLDIPASLEESQVLPGKRPERRIYSAPAPEEPFETPEPKHGLAHMSNADTQSPAAQIATLMTVETLRSAVHHVKNHCSGSLCLPRITRPEESLASEGEALIPQDSHYLHGSIQDQRQIFSNTAPKFNLILLDPPWPNRSARRKSKGYKTAPTLSGIRAILQNIPIPSHLAPDGLVAVWITNKPSIVELLTARGGLFEEWGLQLAAEWTWLKITPAGEPIFDLDSSWRKPWEKLLIARRAATSQPHISDMTILAAPDVHSRKPSLKGLFQPILGSEYPGLEIFARSLTAGWWSWGDQVLKFQAAEHWVPVQSGS